MADMQNRVVAIAFDLGYIKNATALPDGTNHYHRNVVNTPEHSIIDEVNVGIGNDGGFNLRYERIEDGVLVIKGDVQGISLQDLETFMMGPGVHSAAKVPNMELYPTYSKEEIEGMGSELRDKILTPSVADWYSDRNSTDSDRVFRQIEDYPDLAALTDGSQVVINEQFGTIRGYEHGWLTIVDYAFVVITNNEISGSLENQKSLLDKLRKVDNLEPGPFAVNLTSLPGPPHWVRGPRKPGMSVYIVSPREMAK